MRSLTYTSRIAGLYFSIAGTEDVIKESSVGITSYDLFRDNKPVDGGLYNAHLGTTDYEYKCKTCFHRKSHCLGHDGHYMLNYPVMSPMCIAEIRKWLKLICFECGKPIISERVFSRFGPMKRLDEAQKIARTAARKCVHCHAVHPIVRKDTTDQIVTIAEYYTERRKTSEEIMYPHRIAEIFNRIEPATVVALGRPLASHPRKFILSAIKIPPANIRPDSDSSAQMRGDDNKDITTMLQIIVKKNMSMPTVVPAVIDLKLRKAIFELSTAYYELIRAGGNANNLGDRLKGKYGRFRKTCLGKRVHNMFRSTIVGDSTLHIDEVSVPLKFAKNNQMREIVQEYNKRELMRYVQNGRDKYPGCTEIRKRASGALIAIDNILDVDLEPGDELYRDMVTGDWFNYNRQPSIKPSNISGMRMRVVEDPSVLTLGMNVISCPAFDADFDGDQMNGIVNPSIAPRNELRMLSAFRNWFIFHSHSAPGIGQTDDSVIGLFELTLGRVRVDKYHAMAIFANTTYTPSFADMAPGDTISGRDCISRILEHTPVNFTRKPSYYQDKLAPYMRYDPGDTRVSIERGRMVSGVLDKSSIGKGAAGGLYHIVANDYGTARALELIYDMQQMAIAYTLQHGYTIGINDLLVSPDAKAEIDRIAADIINKGDLITDKLNRGEIIPPIGMTVEEFYEEQQIASLKPGDDFIDPVLGSFNPHTNCLLKMVLSGSKGSLDNVFNIVSSIGQKLINGERIRQKFGHKRTLAYYRRFDTAPVSRGYIINSYMGGMTMPEYIFNAMNARFDLISKALLTSVTGEQNRKSIKNLESIIVNNLRFSCKHHNILQLIYGEDGLDPRAVEVVEFTTVGATDAALAERYRVTAVGDVALPPALAELAARDHDAIRADRDRYRELFMRVETMNPGERMQTSRLSPVNIARILVDVTREYADIAAPIDWATPDGAAAVEQMHADVQELIAGIPWLHSNEGYRAHVQSVPPEYLAHACWLLQMLLRANLSLATLLHMNPQLVRIVCDRVRMVYLRALIDPGSAVGVIAALAFSGPLTQYVLDAHHRSAAGGTSKSGMTHVKEVMAARDVDKLESPQMQLRVLPSLEGNSARVQEIANNIEMMQLRQFVTIYQVFYEKFGAPVHTAYVHEADMITSFARMNPLMTPPGDLIKWCIRAVINKTTLVLKNMTVDLIVTRLREMYPDTYIVYTGENTPEIVLRIYMRNGLRDARGNAVFKAGIETQHVVDAAHMFIDTIIRGVSGITNTNVVKHAKTVVDAAGALTTRDIYVIETVGTNLRGVLANRYIDPLRVSTDAILETYRMFGIEAARQKIICELRKLSQCNHRHYLMYADEMTSTGRVTSIERSGLSTREASNYLLRIGFSSPLPTLEEAGICAVKDEITGVTAPLLVGSVPRIGTLYNAFHMDEQMIRENVKRPDDILDLL